MNPKPGEVWLADLGLAAKTRPVVIVSREDNDPPRAIVVYVPLTRQSRSRDYEGALPPQPFLKGDSTATAQGVASIPTVQLEAKLGRLPESVLAEITQALAYTLNIPNAD